MSVTVVRHYGGTGTPNFADVYEDATAIEVSEGHLLVKGDPSSERGSRPTVAAYQPGSWLSAFKDQTLVVKTGSNAIVGQ